jgi:hypothetical protein
MAVTLVGTVGSAHNESATTGTSIATIGTKTITAGNTVVVCVGIEDATSITNVTDGTTTVTVPDVILDWVGGTEKLAIFSFPNHPGGAKTFTANFAATQPFRAIVVLELTPCTFDVSSTGSGNSAAPSSGSLTPSVSGSYIVGFCFGNSALTSAGGFADYFNEPTVNTTDTEGLAQAVAAAIAATWTMTSGIWGAVAASYKPPASAFAMEDDYHVAARPTRDDGIVLVTA